MAASLDMLSMLAPLIGALAVFAALMFWWPGPLTGLASLLLLAFACHRYAQRIGREHRH